MEAARGNPMVGITLNDEDDDKDGDFE